jgi:hypothetical protein
MSSTKLAATLSVSISIVLMQLTKHCILQENHRIDSGNWRKHAEIDLGYWSLCLY